MKYFNFFYLPLLFLFLLSSTSHARDYLDVTADIRKIPTAVPYFKDKDSNSTASEIDRTMAQILGGSLAFHGFLSIIKPEKYNGSPDADWSAVGAEMTVLGSYSVDGSSITLELRMMDILEGQMVLGRRYRGAWNKRNRMLYKFCDEAIAKLSGDKGNAQSLISFVSETNGIKEIYVADILGEQIRQITKHKSIAVSPRFSPDGQTLLYTSYHRGRQVLYKTRLGSKTTRAISWRDGLNMAPSWSPTEDILALTLSIDGSPDLFLTTTNPPRGKQIRIIERLTRKKGINVSPSWSPTGQQLAYVSDRSGSPQIYIYDTQKKSSRRLTYEGGYNTSPAWSPKGDLIAYSAMYNGTYHIFTIPVSGGIPSQVTRSWGSHESPSWSPDGKQIVFSRKRENQQHICVIFKNGSELRVLYRLSGAQSLPQWSSRLSY